MSATEEIKRLLLDEFADFVIKIEELRSRHSAGSSKIRIFIKDASYIDVFYSESKKISCHWERRLLDGKIYRVDNAPDHKETSTYPWHLHDGADDIMKPFDCGDNLIEVLKKFLEFVRNYLQYGEQ